MFVDLPGGVQRQQLQPEVFVQHARALLGGRQRVRALEQRVKQVLREVAEPLRVAGVTPDQEAVVLADMAHRIDRGHLAHRHPLVHRHIPAPIMIARYEQVIPRDQEQIITSAGLG